MTRRRPARQLHEVDKLRFGLQHYDCLKANQARLADIRARPGLEAGAASVLAVSFAIAAVASAHAGEADSRGGGSGFSGAILDAPASAEKDQPPAAAQREAKADRHGERQHRPRRGRGGYSTYRDPRGGRARCRGGLSVGAASATRIPRPTTRRSARHASDFMPTRNPDCARTTWIIGLDRAPSPALVVDRGGECNDQGAHLDHN
jgi:hypothetical protein